MIIIVLILILGVGVTPFVFGIKAENAYRKWVKDWAELTDLRVVSTKYDRGWFSSEAETTYEYRRRDIPILMLNEHDSVVHGPMTLKGIWKQGIKLEPFLAHIKTELRGQLKNPSELADMLGLLPPLEIDTVFSIQGNGKSSISMQPFSYRHKNLKESLTWSGLSGDSIFVPKGNILRMDFVFPGLEIMDDGFSLSFSKGEVDVDLQDEENKLNGQHNSISLKTENIEVRNFSLGSSEIRSLSLDGLESSWSSVRKNGLTNSSQKIGIARLTFNESNKFGPGTFEFSVSNIPSDALHEISKSIDVLGGEFIRDELKRLRLFSMVMRYLPQLADHQTEFEITRLSLAAPDGEFMAHAKVYIDGEGSRLKLNPFYAMEALHADATVTVPKGMLERVIKEITKEEIKEAIKQSGEQMPDDDVIASMAETAANEKVDGLLKLNIFELDDEKYELKLAYSKGRLELNGKSIPIPMLSP